MGDELPRAVPRAGRRRAGRRGAAIDDGEPSANVEARRRRLHASGAKVVLRRGDRRRVHGRAARHRPVHVEQRRALVRARHFAELLDGAAQVADGVGGAPGAEEQDGEIEIAPGRNEQRKEEMSKEKRQRQTKE